MLLIAGGVGHLRVLGELEANHGVARALERDRLAATPAGVLPQGAHRVGGCVGKGEKVCIWV